jgi:GAF domain-containing protein
LESVIPDVVVEPGHGHDTLGALNLYSAKRDAFDREAQHIGELFAVHAAIALANSRHESNLLAALDSRDVIGMAKGILMGMASKPTARSPSSSARPRSPS